MTQLRKLEDVAEQIEELERQRAALIRKRDALLESLHPQIGATTLARTSHLSTAGVYKIIDRQRHPVAVAE